MSGIVTYKSPRQKIKRVFANVTDAILQGYAFCYDYDNGTAASVDPDRALIVEKPTTTNAMWFAGVAAQGYVANASGQWIDIIEPGSVAEIYTNQNCTLQTTRVSFCAAQYYFSAQGFPGIGSAQCLQTIDRSSTSGLVQAYLEVGPQSGGVELLTPTAGAITPGTYGVTYFPATTLASDATYTLANGSWIGQKKGFILNGTMTTSDIVVTVTTAQIIAAVATTGYDVVTMDASTEYAFFTWNGKAWEIQAAVAA